MNRCVLPTLTLSLFTLTASAALACPLPPEPEFDPMDGLVPFARGGSEIPLNGALLFDGDRFSDVGLPALVDPEGAAVEWEVRHSAIDPRLHTAAPRGGWVVGEYTEADDDESLGDLDEDGPVEEPIRYVVVDEVDEEPPEATIESWIGSSHALGLPYPCGSIGSSHSGVKLELGDPGEAVIFRIELIAADGDTEVHYRTSRSGFYFAPQGSRWEVIVEAVDLASNIAMDSSLDVVACAGCSGSMAGGRTTGGALALLALLGVLGRRRRAGLELSAVEQSPTCFE